MIRQECQKTLLSHAPVMVVVGEQTEYLWKYDSLDLIRASLPSVSRSVHLAVSGIALELLHLLIECCVTSSLSFSPQIQPRSLEALSYHIDRCK